MRTVSGSPLRWSRALGDEPEPEWRGEIDQVFFSARWFENEVVFFHRASRTSICAAPTLGSDRVGVLVA